MLVMNVIQPVQTIWPAPTTLAPRKNSSLRYCIITRGWLACQFGTYTEMHEYIDFVWDAKICSTLAANCDHCQNGNRRRGLRKDGFHIALRFVQVCKKAVWITKTAWDVSVRQGNDIWIWKAAISDILCGQYRHIFGVVSSTSWKFEFRSVY